MTISSGTSRLTSSYSNATIPTQHNDSERGGPAFQRIFNTITFLLLCHDPINGLSHQMCRYELHKPFRVYENGFRDLSSDDPIPPCNHSKSRRHLRIYLTQFSNRWEQSFAWNFFSVHQIAQSFRSRLERCIRHNRDPQRCNGQAKPRKRVTSTRCFPDSRNRDFYLSSYPSRFKLNGLPDENAARPLVQLNACLESLLHCAFTGS